MAGNIVYIPPKQRLPSGEDDHLGTEGFHLIENVQTLSGREFVVRTDTGVQIAMGTRKVTLLREIPRDERWTV